MMKLDLQEVFIMFKGIKAIPLFLLILILMGTAGCSSSASSKQPPDVTFTFSKDVEGWTGDFADYSTEINKEDLELDFKQSDVPVQGKTDKGLMVKGHNRSDDLFMFITRKFGSGDGLKPNTSYKVDLSFDLATKEAGGMMGIGGSPGGSVYMKAGAVNVEPRSEKNKDNFYAVNFDKGNQAEGGKDMTVLGNIEKTDSSDETYQYKPFQKSFEVKTNDKGEAWVIIGTDSGFEGLTQIYYTNIKIAFSEK
jgi:hypothetical protein